MKVPGGVDGADRHGAHPVVVDQLEGERTTRNDVSKVRTPSEERSHGLSGHLEFRQSSSLGGLLVLRDHRHSQLIVARSASSSAGGCGVTRRCASLGCSLTFGPVDPSALAGARAVRKPQHPEELVVASVVRGGQWLQPQAGLCGRCDRIHDDRDVAGEVFQVCIPCRAEVVELALEFDLESDVED